MYERVEQAQNVMKQLAGARRCHRWCKEFPVIQQIIAMLPTSVPKSICVATAVEKTAELFQKVFLATFMIIDHIGWLKSVKILKGGKRAGTGTIQLGLKFFCLSNVLGALLALRKARACGKDQEANRSKFMEAWFKSSLIVLQTLHLSRTYELHDWYVGIFGMITSGMDVKTNWPAKK